MAFRRGFKSEANELVAEVRQELGLSLYEPLDVAALAESLEIPILALSDLASDRSSIRHLIDVEPEAFSAVTVFCGTARTIVHNDGHAAVRQTSNITHEIAHGLLHHPPTPALDNAGCRLWDERVEDEANWLSGALLVPEEAAMLIAKGRWPTTAQAAQHYRVSQKMIRFRLNATGANVRVRRARAAGAARSR